MKHFGDMFYQNKRETEKQRLKIFEVLKGKQLSVSEISSELGLEKPVVLWNLLGMLRWGQVDVLEGDGELIFVTKEE